MRKFFKLFPDDKSAQEWFIKSRWPNGICCPYCGSTEVNTGTNHKSMPYRCKERECRKWFSVKTGTPMQSSKLGCHDWLYAMYSVSTNLKSISSMKLHRDLEITQKSVWFLLHRIRHVWGVSAQELFEGPVEADESYFGGKRKNMPKSKRAKMEGRGPVGKVAVVGVKDRTTNRVVAKVVPDTRGETLREFVQDNIEPGAKVYTDDTPAYDALPNREAVKHSLMEYVRGPIHTNGIESFWSLLKRAHMGTFHRLSERHLHRYVAEFTARHNMRDKDTLQQLVSIAGKMDGKRLRYRDLVG